MGVFRMEKRHASMGSLAIDIEARWQWKIK
jgi:hypothetical protein